MAIEEIKGNLVVKKTKAGKNSFLVRFEGKKGPTEMAILPQAIFFAEKDGTDGSPVTITRDGGKITKVTIDGKEECSPNKPQKPESRPAPGAGMGQRGGPSTFRRGPAPSTGGRGGYAPSSGGWGGGGSFGPVDIPDATAPYNFVEQNYVLPAPDISAEERFSGILSCTLKTLTPLLVSGKQSGKSTATDVARKNFFSINGRYIVPGSSLKGLLRSYLETITCSAMTPMNNKRVFWRNFDDVLYKEIFKMGQTRESPQKAGYLVRHGADFEIVPVHYTPVSINAPNNPGKIRVASGPMMSKKHDYDFDSFESHANEPGLRVSYELLDDFLLQLTPGQLSILRKYGVENENDLRRKLTKPLPVFYLEDKGNIAFFGIPRFFRYPAKYTPTELMDKTMPPLPEGVNDFAMQLFGFTRKTDNLVGRVSCTAAIFPERTPTKELPAVVLGQPKHTCFAHYLRQDKKSLAPMRKNKNRWDINSMHTYNTFEKIRGRKFYWHRDPLITPPDERLSKKCQSLLVPIAEGAVAEFSVHLNRVTLLELGAILEALILPEGHAHHLGMGKSLGLGSIRIDLAGSDITPCRELYADPMNRCLRFFAGEKIAQSSQDELFAKAREAYRAWLLNALKDKGEVNKDYASIPHIASFLRMTDFAHKPSNEKTNHMDLREFQKRRVLATPLEIR